jgi:hypothetical protein
MLFRRYAPVTSLPTDPSNTTHLPHHEPAESKHQDIDDLTRSVEKDLNITESTLDKKEDVTE